jgi:hypothetical protein
MTTPTRDQAEAVLAEGASLNPGNWVEHSRVVARTAQTIAAHHPDLEPERVYVLGLLHDIGRREGVTDMRHILDGYRFLQTLGWKEAARISLTHSYPIKDASSGAGEWDGSQAELQFVQDLLDSITYTRYDSLIQLCDALCLPEGVVLMEKRLLDVIMRHGFNHFSLPRIQAFQQIKAGFEEELGTSIYRLLPEAIANTFGFSPQN